MTHRPANKPAIRTVGKVHDDGTLVAVSGWGLGICITGCRCHYNPVGGQLSIHQDPVRGLLGITKYRDCDCCEPWTSEELAEVLCSFQSIEQIPTVTSPEREGQS